jgi:hypothetical protein
VPIGTALGTTVTSGEFRTGATSANSRAYNENDDLICDGTTVTVSALPKR